MIVLGATLTLVGVGGAACAQPPAPHAATTQIDADRLAQDAVVTPLGLGQRARIIPLARPATPPPQPPYRPTRIDATLDQIARDEAAAELIEEKLNDADEVLTTKSQHRDAVREVAATAQTATASAQEDLSAWAREAFMAESSRPSDLATDPRNAMLGQAGSLRIDTPRLRLELAKAKQAAAADVLAVADAAVDVQQAQVDRLRTELSRLGSTIRRLRAVRTTALVVVQREQDAKRAVVARQHLRDAGGTAAGAARTAIGFALAQRGKPYEWGTEGPDEYDCSGLVQTAYAQADIALPRTARPQYRVSKPVPVTALLPGDLLFFATDRSDWNTIHHVGIYLGKGLMVHAPTTGDVVRVAPVWWSEFFGAGRVVAPSSPTASAARPGR